MRRGSWAEGPAGVVADLALAIRFGDLHSDGAGPSGAEKSPSASQAVAPLGSVRGARRTIRSNPGSPPHRLQTPIFEPPRQQPLAAACPSLSKEGSGAIFILVCRC